MRREPSTLHSPDAPAAATSYTEMIIVKSDGTDTRAMAQQQATSYMENLLRDQGKIDRIPNLKQSMNQAFDGGGKATGAYTFRGRPVQHASSGNGQRSVSLFFVVDTSDRLVLFAAGEHADATTYKIDIYGQPSGPFTLGATIRV